MLTAIRAVELIQNQSTDKSSLWNVNTESDYQEIKEEDRNSEK